MWLEQKTLTIDIVPRFEHMCATNHWPKHQNKQLFSAHLLMTALQKERCLHVIALPDCPNGNYVGFQQDMVDFVQVAFMIRSLKMCQFLRPFVVS